MKPQSPAPVKVDATKTSVETDTPSTATDDLRLYVYIQVRIDPDEDSTVTFDHRFVRTDSEKSAYETGQEHMQMDGVVNDYVIDVTELIDHKERNT